MPSDHMEDMRDRMSPFPEALIGATIEPEQVSMSSLHQSLNSIAHVLLVPDGGHLIDNKFTGISIIEAEEPFITSGEGGTTIGVGCMGLLGEH